MSRGFTEFVYLEFTQFLHCGGDIRVVLILQYLAGFLQVPNLLLPETDRIQQLTQPRVTCV